MLFCVTLLFLILMVAPITPQTSASHTITVKVLQVNDLSALNMQSSLVSETSDSLLREEKSTLSVTMQNTVPETGQKITVDKKYSCFSDAKDAAMIDTVDLASEDVSSVVIITYTLTDQ